MSIFQHVINFVWREQVEMTSTKPVKQRLQGRI